MADFADRTLVLNPNAGSADHADRLHVLAAEHDMTVRETDAPGDAIAIARDAATDASLVAAAGGDGTVNEVVRGLSKSGRTASVTLGIVPVGTGNNLAGNLGIKGIDHAFDVIEHGTVRTVDVGVANDRPFLNSCIGGLTAQASAETSSSAKERLGVLAYVLSTLRTAAEFDGLPLHIEGEGVTGRNWGGDAAFVLIGNGRRFPAEGRSQADMEDGHLDVTVIEDRPVIGVVGEAAAARLLGADTTAVTRFSATELSVSVIGPESVTFSLDGEMTEARSVDVSVDEARLDVAVGESYEPHPGS